MPGIGIMARLGLKPAAVEEGIRCVKRGCNHTFTVADIIKRQYISPDTLLVTFQCRECTSVFTVQVPMDTVMETFIEAYKGVCEN